MIKMLDKF